ncbi:MAG: hypothetical protein HY717_12795 [Planctomycetes bacterium]|nr:hypothetical protein [Planctomycetota bacterium]
MKRTNLVIEDAQYEYLKLRSEQAGQSMSAIVRELIDAMLRQHLKPSPLDPIHSIIGLGRSKKGRNPGRRHDEILYRKEK